MLGKLAPLALSLFLATSASADSWSSPQTTAQASPSGQHVVRVLPGAPRGATATTTATAIMYRLDAAGDYVRQPSFQLLNPVAPVFVAVSDAGDLVTLDDWHSVGVGNAVVVVYSPQGRVVRNLGLADIYAPQEIAKFSESVSSVWWRCHAQTRLNSRAGTLELMDVLGFVVTVRLKTGEVSREPSGKTGC
ncbi:hypothetical protein ACG02S_11670 [Roseateles sp. DC23W]|uniref:Uncharacterized protein n=1 Tax=Pelomonas dachongensis TaxID=3299029 RepID=A0ABW7EM66_9BURK